MACDEIWWIYVSEHEIWPDTVSLNLLLELHLSCVAESKALGLGVFAFFNPLSGLLLG